jgi:lysophospholipase L1-like esterase
MRANLIRAFLLAVASIALVTTVPLALAQYWVSYDDYTRYMALGDSLTAGYAAHPATQGFAYQLYQTGVFDNVNHTLFSNAAVSGSLSIDVLDHQVPLVSRFFSETGKPYRKAITLTVGGNDMMQILAGVDPRTVIQTFGANLYSILAILVNRFPDARIYVANQYDPMLPVPGGAQLVAALNETISAVTYNFRPNVVLVDIFAAFQGRNGLLLIEKMGADTLQIHPTNAGYNVMAKAFSDAIRQQDGF